VAHLQGIRDLRSFDVIREVAEAVDISDSAGIHVQARERHALLSRQEADPVPKVDLVLPHEGPEHKLHILPRMHAGQL
jgi:hypothetical protein